MPRPRKKRRVATDPKPHNTIDPQPPTPDTHPALIEPLEDLRKLEERFREVSAHYETALALLMESALRSGATAEHVARACGTTVPGAKHRIAARGLSKFLLTAAQSRTFLASQGDLMSPTAYLGAGRKIRSKREGDQG